MEKGMVINLRLFSPQRSGRGFKLLINCLSTSLKRIIGFMYMQWAKLIELSNVDIFKKFYFLIRKKKKKTKSRRNNEN